MAKLEDEIIKQQRIRHKLGTVYRWECEECGIRRTTDGEVPEGWFYENPPWDPLSVRQAPVRILCVGCRAGVF